MDTTSKQLAIRLASAYPGRRLGEMHIASWAEDLLGIGEVAGDVVDLARRRFASPPSSAQLYELARECERDLAEVRRYDELRHPAIVTPEKPYLSREDMLHGLHHLRELLARNKRDRTPAMRLAAKQPWGCSCGFVAPIDADPGERLAEVVTP